MDLNEHAGGGHMHALIVDDDRANQLILQKYLIDYGTCDMAGNGREAVLAFRQALEKKHPYNLILLDLLMPEMGGQEALTIIREIEEKQGIIGLDGVKIIMTTSIDDFKAIAQAFSSQCEGYLIKPIQKQKFIEQLHALGFVPTRVE
jgi:two-component system chemotaxis response regulator CheY